MNEKITATRIRVNSPHEAERQAQIAAGRMMTDDHDDDTPMSKRVSSYTTQSARSLIKRPVTAPKGHEAFLKALEASGATITITMASSGDTITGVVRHSDSYTISVRSIIGVKAGADGTIEDVTKDRVIFKHDISEFSALTHRAETTKAPTLQ